MTDISVETPEQPSTETQQVSKTDPQDGSTIECEFEPIVDGTRDRQQATIRWSANWPDGKATGRYGSLNAEEQAVVFQSYKKINEIRTRGIEIPTDVYEALQDDVEALEAWAEEANEAYRTAIEAQPLTFEVISHEFTTGTWRTKYQHEKRVLKPSKDSLDRSTEEDDVLAALKQELGEADDLPLAEGEDNPLADLEVGTELSVDELSAVVDGLEDAVEAIVEERERGADRAALRDEHSALYGVQFDPEAVREGLSEATETGKPVTVVKTIADCNDDDRECSLDHVRYVATPDGEIDTRRTHTH